MTTYEEISDSAVERHAYVTAISDELLADARELHSAVDRWMSATSEEREQWSEEAKQARVAERREAVHVPLTLDTLLDKLGFSHAYAEHLVQPYCECGDSADGWDRCAHARDLGLEMRR